MKVRELVDDDEDNVLPADFLIRCAKCEAIIGYRSPGDDPGYSFCDDCHEVGGEFVVDLRTGAPL